MNDILRSLVIFQLAATVCAFTVILIVKRNYYFTRRLWVTMILSGMILLCVFGAGLMYERLGQPIHLWTALLFAASALIDIGTIGAFWGNKFASR